MKKEGIQQILKVVFSRPQKNDFTSTLHVSRVGHTKFDKISRELITLKMKSYLNISKYSVVIIVLGVKAGVVKM